MKEIAEILLNGVPLHQFIAFYIAGAVGAIFSFGINVGSEIKKNNSTPTKFSRKHFKVKAWRLITGIITLALGIVFSKEIAGFMLQSDAVIELNLWSAFGSGMVSDRIGKQIASIRNNGT